MGAVGLTCAATEMAAAGGVGIDLDLDAVPLREPGLDAYDIMLSESQERFLLIVDRPAESDALEHFRVAGVHAATVGRVTATGRVVAVHGGDTVADLPAAMVAGGAPDVVWESAPTSSSVSTPSVDPVADPGAALVCLLADPNIATAASITSRYDSTVGNRTIRGPGDAEAAVLRLPDSDAGYALVVTGRGDRCAADPYLGTMAEVGAARLRLACAGGAMVAVTDGINHGSPSDPVEFGRLSEVIRGLGDALRALGIPVTGGNVSLYNESPVGAIPPTPMIGALGTVADVHRIPKSRISPGDHLVLLGTLRDSPVVSRFAALFGAPGEGDPILVDLAAEDALACLLLDLTAAGTIGGAKAAGPGGLAVALAKLCLRSGVGAVVDLPIGSRRADWMLFGEYPGQAWISTADPQRVASAAGAAGIPSLIAGRAGGERLRVSGLIDETLRRLNDAFEGSP
jgi:phosphoribosylformylglycinamidine synthase